MIMGITFWLPYKIKAQSTHRFLCLSSFSNSYASTHTHIYNIYIYLYTYIDRYIEMCFHIFRLHWYDYTHCPHQLFITAHLMRHKTKRSQIIFAVWVSAFAPHHSSLLSGASWGAHVANSAAVADGVEEAAVAGVTGITTGKRVAQTGLLVRDAATRWTHGPTLQL